MMCTEFRDLAELLADGALAGPQARAALDHRAECADCRSFEEECAVLLAPLHGFPPGPYLPPARPGHLPPWASGPVFGILLALLLAGGAGAWALKGKVTGASPAPVGKESARAPRPVRPPAATPAPSLLDDPDGVPLTGRVIAFPGRTPVAGVAISIDGVPAGNTDAGGVFRVRGLAPAGSRLLRMAPPGMPATEALLPDLEPGMVHTLADLLVGRPSPATARVVRWDARPEAGIRVRACRLAPTVHPDSQPVWRPGSRGPVLPPQEVAVTDAAGLAEFPALAPGTWTFQAEREGIPFSEPVEVEVLDDPELTAILFLDPATAFEGRVLEDATGAPVEGARVRWSRIGTKTGYDDFRLRGTTVTDAGGRFRFAAAPAVPLLLDVRRPGAPCASGGIAVDASRVDGAEIRLPPAATAAGACLESGTGLPAAGAVIRISVDLSSGMCSTHEHFLVRAGPDGRFEARGIPETALLQVSLQPHSAWCDPGPMQANHLRAGTPVRIEGFRASAVEGRVLDAEGRPAPGRPVIAMEILHAVEGMGGMALRVAQGFADAEGRFRLENLPPGRAFLVSPEPGDLDSFPIIGEARAALDSPEPPTSVVAIPVPSGEGPFLRARPLDPVTGGSGSDAPVVRIRGRVLDLAGAPAAGTALRLLQGDLGGFMGNKTASPVLWIPVGEPVPVAEDGSFEAEGRPGGVSTLIATSPRHPPSHAVVRFEGNGGAYGVLLTLETGHTLAGRVLHEDGTPAAGALLEALPQGDARSTGNLAMVRARTAEDGSFRIDGLYGGPHTLTVGRGPGPVHAVPGALPGGEPVEIRLPRGDGVRPGMPLLHRPWKEATDGERTATLEGRIPGAAGRLLSVLAFDPTAPSHRPLVGIVDEAGHFSVRVPPWRRLSLAMNIDDGRWVYADDLPSGSNDVVLRIEGPAAGLLRGRVVTPAGAAGVGIPVHAVRLRGEGEANLPSEVVLEGREWSAAGVLDFHVPRFVRTTLTESDGSFDLGSPPGRWAVFAGLPGTGESASAAPVPWSAADPRALELPLAPGRVLRVAAVDDDAPPDARPPAYAELRLDGFLPGPALSVRVPRPPGGLYEFLGLPSGPVTVLLLDGRRREVGRAAAEPGDPRDPPVKIAVKH